MATKKALLGAQGLDANGQPIVNATNITASNTITAGTFSGSGASLTNIPNSALNNSSITINSTPVSLGGSITVSATDSSKLPLAGGTLTGSLSGTSASFSSSVTASSLIKSGGISSQFLKADGSVDANTYYLASNPSGYITSSATITGDARNITQYAINQNLSTTSSPTFSGLTVDTNTLFVDATNDRVGVGTVSPSAKLDVNGGDLLVDASSVGDERGIFFRRGFTSTDKYNVSILVKDHDGNFPDGLSINAYDGISFCTGSNTRNERMRLNVNGNLGLSTTNPVYKMQIEPTSVTAGGVNNLLRIGTQSTTTGTTSRFSMFCSTDPVNDTNGGKVFIDAIRTATNMDLAFSLNNTGGASPVERMRLTGAGYLGIANPSPQSLLHIGADGNATITTSYDLQFNHYVSTWGANATRTYLKKGWNATVNDYLYLSATGNGSNTAMGSIFLSNSVPFSCGYGSNTADGLSNEFLRVTNTGNVGISNSAPSQKLDINGNIRLFGSSNNVYLLLRNNHQSIWGARVLCWDYGDGQGINFETSDNTDTWGTRMVVRHNGGVGIGTTAPAYKLDINGTARTTGRFYSNEWIQFDNYTGLYSPINGAHFLPNASSYGSWKVLGQRNGWCGLEFETTSNGAVSLMIRPDAIETGFHNNSNGWQLRWNGGTLYCHKGTYGGGTVATVLDSSNYSSYAIPNGGSWLGDLGSYGFTRYAGLGMPGGAEVVFLYKGGQGYTLVDGSYYAFEGGGFYSSSNSSGGTLIGMKAIATNTLELNARTSIRRSVYSVGANDFFMELTAPDDGSGSGEIGLRFHLENRYWRQIRANSGGFVFTQGGDNNTVPITASNVIAQNEVSATNGMTHYGGNRIPRTIVSTSTPGGTINDGDVWLQY